MGWLVMDFILAGIVANVVAHWLIGVYEEVKEERKEN